MRINKRLKSIRTITEGLLQRYFKLGKEDLEKVDIENLDDPCFGCLILSICSTECADKATHKILDYLNRPDVDPNSCAFAVTQNTVTKELKIR